MMKIIKYILIILIFAVILFPFVTWHFYHDRNLNVTIIDKTVPDFSYREHKGLVWILNNQKYVKPNGKRYNSKTDYYGFFPGENKTYKIKDLPKSLNDSDVIYIADTYGVYEEEYYGDKKAGNRSRKIYGGLDQKEAEIIKKSVDTVRSYPQLLIAEFNSFASPTREETRKIMYDILGLKWSGWIGRYFFNLQKNVEVPNWAVKNYEAKYGKKWEFKEAGFILANEQDDIVVLEEKKDVNNGFCEIEFTQQGKNLFNINSRIQYDYWFDIVKPFTQSEVIANYHMDITDSGLKKLNDHSIPSDFPAIISNYSKTYSSFYFAGDYTDTITVPDFFQIEGIDIIKSLMMTNKETKFFWECYVPMMQEILKDHYINKRKKKLYTGT